MRLPAAQPADLITHVNAVPTGPWLGVGQTLIEVAACALGVGSANDSNAVRVRPTITTTASRPRFM